MAQWHDEPHALWRQIETRKKCSPDRLEYLLSNIKDWNLFAAFLIIDGCTAGKARVGLAWFLDLLASRGIETRFSTGDIIMEAGDADDED
jgi:hypothetical protein